MNGYFVPFPCTGCNGTGYEAHDAPTVKDSLTVATPPVGEPDTAALLHVIGRAFSPTFEPSRDVEIWITSLPATTQSVLREFQRALPYDSEFKTEDMAATIHELRTQRDAATQRAEAAEADLTSLRAAVAKVRGLPTKNIARWSPKSPGIAERLVVEYSDLLAALPPEGA